MDEIFRETLKRSHVYLVENIQYEDLVDVLLERDVLSRVTIEDINSISGRRKQVRKLLEVLPRRSNETFETFLQCLESTHQKHIADSVRETYRKLEHGFYLPPEKNLQPSNKPLPKLPWVKSLPGRNIESNQSETIEMGASVMESEPTDDNSVLLQQRFKKKDCYAMDSYPCGYMLIINNEKFADPILRDRNGSSKDADDLKNLFWRLGFFCDIQHNLTVEQIKQSLLEFSKLDNHKKLNCCAVVLMSHGDEGHIFGYAGKKVSVNELLVYFSDQDCPNLEDKPKLFIIQACRDNTPSKKQTDDPNDVSQKRPTVMRLMSLDLSSDNAVRNSRADMLIAYSTASGNKSYRHKATGSIFIQNIIEIFSKKADTTSVTDMLIEVNRKLREQYPNIGQIGAPEVALTKKWFLKPIKT